MANLTYTEYWDEINNIVSELVAESMADCDNDREQAEEQINDYRLHEWIDGHQWVIYYAYNTDVINHSDNYDYFIDNFGADALAEAAKGGLSSVHTALAFWCMYADVQQQLDSAFDT